MNQNEKKSPYEDIINLPHHVSTTRPRMSAIERAAQFSPFAALTGYDAAIKETARQTTIHAELDELQKLEINERLLRLVEHINECPKATITYFVSDKIKSGGEYVSVTAHVKKIDEYERIITFTEGFNIPIDEIYSVEIDENLSCK